MNKQHIIVQKNKQKANKTKEAKKRIMDIRGIEPRRQVNKTRQVNQTFYVH